MARRPIAGRRKVIRGYTDLTVIRSGPLWTLYRAVDVETSKPVVMRVVRASIGTELLEDLAAETLRLQEAGPHPHIATPLRFLRRSDGSAVSVTELCRGSLADRATLRPDPAATIGRAVSTVTRVAGGLAAAHQAGLVHRGVKPSRILVTRGGDPVIEGFGLASLSIAAGEPGAHVGPHTAPEVFEGREPSPATDVYGLASTLYELLGGRAPFQVTGGDTPAEMILRIVGTPAPPLHVPDVPLALADLLLVSLSKDPVQRPAGAAEFADELARSAPAADLRDDTPAATPAGEPGHSESRDSDPGDGGEGSGRLTAEPAGRWRARRPGRSPATTVYGRRNVLQPLTSGRGNLPPPSAERLPARPRLADPVSPERAEFADPSAVVPPGSGPGTAPAGGPAGRSSAPRPYRRRTQLLWLAIGAAAAVAISALLVLLGVL